MATYDYDAICFRQRTGAKIWFCQIAAPAGQILQWARVDRMDPNNVKGVQRAKNDSKTKSIGRFFQADSQNTIPTTMTIALPITVTNFLSLGIESNAVVANAVRLSILVQDGQPLPGLIIDGQHRIYGINEFDPLMPVGAVVVLGADDAEIAFQFLVINNKVSKVSPDHIRALRLAYKEDQLNERLTKSARMKSSGASAYLEAVDSGADSPFNGRLKWPRNKETGAFQLIPPNAFEAALLHISTQQLVSSIDLETKNSDYVLDLFLEVWKEVQIVWPDAWADPNSRLLSKLGVVCMSQYLVETLVNRVEAAEKFDAITDLLYVRQVIASILARQEYMFWTAPWSLSSLDTSAGRDIVTKDLRKIAINKRSSLPWNSGLRLIEALE